MACINFSGQENILPSNFTKLIPENLQREYERYVKFYKFKYGQKTEEGFLIWKNLGMSI